MCDRQRQLEWALPSPMAHVESEKCGESSEADLLLAGRLARIYTERTKPGKYNRANKIWQRLTVSEQSFLSVDNTSVNRSVSASNVSLQHIKMKRGQSEYRSMHEGDCRSLTASWSGDITKKLIGSCFLQ